MKLKAAHSRPHYEARARIAQALAHPTRLLLLEALKDREVCVCDLTALVGADQSTVSKHLAMLRSVGLVELREQGSMNFYRARCACLDGFFQCVENVLRENLRAQHQLAMGE
jgi:DNA-binding transcriptional ArsR family regulator